MHDQIQDTVEHISALIDSCIEAGDDENGKALLAEWYEWIISDQREITLFPKFEDNTISG